MRKRNSKSSKFDSVSMYCLIERLRDKQNPNDTKIQSITCKQTDLVCDSREEGRMCEIVCVCVECIANSFLDLASNIPVLNNNTIEDEKEKGKENYCSCFMRYQFNRI